MCTEAQVQKIVHEELIQQTSKLIIRFWWTVGGIIVGTLAAWFGLYYQVQTQSLLIERNYLDNQSAVNSLREDYRTDISEMKQDLRFIREQLSR